MEHARTHMWPYGMAEGFVFEGWNARMFCRGGMPAFVVHEIYFLRILKDAKLLEAAGIFSVVLECVETKLSKKITEQVSELKVKGV